MSMEVAEPLVSICLPIHNGEKFLQEALNSIALQTYSRIELIISDDASWDASLAIINEFKKTINFPVLIYHHEPSGIGANWNYTIEKANGEFIKFLFQDDVLEPTCIEKMVKIFEKNPNLGLVASKREFIIQESFKSNELDDWILKFSDLQKNIPSGANDDYFHINKELFKTDYFFKSPLNLIGEPSVVMFRKNITEEVGWFSTNLKQVLDYEYWFRILKTKDIIIIKESLVKFRLHSAQETNKNRSRKIDDYHLMRKMLYEDYYSLLHPDLQRTLKSEFSIFHILKLKGRKFFKKIIKRLKS